MYYFLAFIYIFLAISFYKNRLLLFLLSFQILSLAAAIFIKKPDYMDNIETIPNCLIMLILNLLVILPWKKYGRIKELSCKNENAWRKVTKILLIISGFTFGVLLVVSIVVNTLVTDINAFKYSDGESMDFYYTMLPFNVRYFILAGKLYTLAYILLPLHFFYLSRGDKKYAFWCGLFSLNIILYGMTFFSRWTILQYAFLYFAMWIMLSRIMPVGTKKRMKKILGVLVIIACVFFISISISRFTDNRLYELDQISKDSPVQDPTMYSFFDYMGQSNSNGIFLLNKYHGNTFHGTYAMCEIHRLFYGLKLIDESPFVKLRSKYWGEFAGAFSGWATYTVYDFGYILGLVVSIAYYVIVIRKGKHMSLANFVPATFLLQIPLCAIFYSCLPTVLFCYFIYFFIWIFISMTKTTRNGISRK